MSLKRNFLYNSILTLSQFIFPVITFPYAARVLGVEGIGITSFIESLSRYFLLFAIVGIPIHGMREIARNRTQGEALHNTFMEIYSIQFYLSIIATALYFVSFFFVKDFENYKFLYLMGGFLIFSNIFSFEWVFQGFEDFKYITIRTVFIRIFSIILLFMFVKTRDDYVWYFFLLIFSSTVNGIVNFFYIRKYFKLKLTTSYQRIKVHLKPIALTGGYLFAISIYSLLTTVLLGFLSSTESVGFYTAAAKFHRIALGLFSALSTVLIPRLSFIATQRDIGSYNDLIKKSMSFVLAFGLPISFSIFLLAPELINIFAGPGYEKSVICVQVMSPIVLITGLAQIFGPEVLIPFSKDKQNMLAVIIGAFVSLVANFILIPLWNELGASVTTVLVELIVASVTLFYARRLVNIQVSVKQLITRILLLLPFYMFYRISNIIATNDFIIVLIYSFLGLLYFTCIEVLVFKNILLRQIWIRINESRNKLLNNDYHFYNHE